MKRKNSAFTVIELITVIVIISILVSLLLPGISMVRNLAKNTQQKAQFTALELALEAFKNDYGQYPESSIYTNTYMGAQKLAEAMVGRDRLGFHPDTDWGEGLVYTWDLYYRGVLSDFNPSGSNKRGTDETDKENFEKRKDPYIELESSNVFRLKSDTSSADKKTGLYDVAVNPLDEDSLVLCDAYKRNKVTVYLPGAKTKMIKAGNPILYYRANLQSKTSNGPIQNRIYNAADNFTVVDVVGKIMKARKETTEDELNDYTIYNNTLGNHTRFYELISDPKVATGSGTDALRYWPYNSQTYILISAGKDGLYGTEDDICNFDK